MGDFAEGGCQFLENESSIDGKILRLAYRIRLGGDYPTEAKGVWGSLNFTIDLSTFQGFSEIKQLFDREHTLKLKWERGSVDLAPDKGVLRP